MPSREELDELLEHFPMFIEMESSASNMSELFPTMQHISMEIASDPKKNFIARVPYGTWNETIEVIMRMKEYSVMQTTEFVKHFVICLLFLYVLYIASDFGFFFFFFS